MYIAERGHGVLPFPGACRGLKGLVWGVETIPMGSALAQGDRVPSLSFRRRAVGGERDASLSRWGARSHLS